MEVDLPEIVAEVEACFAAYETALINNDVDALTAMFSDLPQTIRYGINENLYGAREIHAFRAGRSPAGLSRVLARTVISTYGRDFAIASTLFERASAPDKVGRCWADGNVSSAIWRIRASAWATDPSAWTTPERASLSSSKTSASPALTICPSVTGTAATTPVTWLLTLTRNGVSTWPLATIVCTNSPRFAVSMTMLGPSTSGVPKYAARPMPATTMTMVHFIDQIFLVIIPARPCGFWANVDGRAGRTGAGLATSRALMSGWGNTRNPWLKRCSG